MHGLSGLKCRGILCLYLFITESGAVNDITNKVIFCSVTCSGLNNSKIQQSVTQAYYRMETYCLVLQYIQILCIYNVQREKTLTLGIKYLVMNQLKLIET